MYDSNLRCTHRTIGLEQANIWGCKGFLPKFTKLARKIFGQHFIRILPNEDLFWLDLQTLGAIFSNQTKLGAIFAHIFRDFLKVFKDFAQIFTVCARIFRDFVRIFTKSELSEVRLHPLHPYHCMEQYAD